MIALYAFVALSLGFVWWRFWFFLRDPRRSPPAGEHLILAPADGRVTYVKYVQRGEVPIAIKERRSIALSEVIDSGFHEEGYLIGIYMSPFSVHRNRVPVSGEVVLRKHRSAPRNISMARMYTNLCVGRTPPEDDCAYLIQNERLTVGIKTSSGAVVTATQIADAWVNRVIARVAIGDRVTRGEQYGLIRLGSQVDTFLPASLVQHIRVVPGQRVVAGESILAEAPVARGPLQIREAGAADNARLLELMRRNPMVMDVTSYMDRSPDYFAMHRALPKSTVLLADNGGSLPVASCSVFVHKGRVGTKIVEIGYCTDLIRNADIPSTTALSRLLHGVMSYGARRALPGYFAVNEGNERMMQVARRLGAQKLARLEYIDVFALRRTSLPKNLRFFRVQDDQQLAQALAIFNAHYAQHQLYEPWTPEDYFDAMSRFPGLTRQNIVCMELDGRVVGAALVYNPSPLVLVRLVAYDRATALLARLVGLVHKATGLLFAPPRPGETIPTHQVRRFAAPAELSQHLFAYLCNDAIRAGVHCLSFVHDPRAPISCRNLSIFRLAFAIFAGPNAFDIEAWDGAKPVFFDVTLS